MKNRVLRALIIVIALTLALSSFGVSEAQRTIDSQVTKAYAQGTDEATCPPNRLTADAALDLLKKGNARWKGTMDPRKWADQRAATAKCQRPFAIVITCMDSRVPPELIFDRGLGDIFVIRVAGPVLNADALASLEYALSADVNVKLVLVLGHTVCGAVKGAVDNAGGVYLPELLDKIEPAITVVSNKYNGGIRITSKDERNLSRVSLENARLMQLRIRSKPALDIRGVQVKWGLYYVGTGTVDFNAVDVVPSML